jgi:pimeloyl-ACP methyl ester carboxylesterase
VTASQFACVKEMFVPEVAEAFQRAGITALTYDPRCTGISDGTPRQELDPQQQVSDYSDALTFLATQPMVDPGRIAFWGYSFAGMIVLCAAALDKRARQVISVCPLTEYSFSGKKGKVLAKAMKDRASQTGGNPPFCLPILTESGESPAGFGGATEPENYRLIKDAHRSAPTYQNKATIQTYYKIAMWQPFGLVPMVAPTPCFMLTPANDRISPAEEQTKLFQSIRGAKRHHIEPGKGHMDILAGESFPKLMAMQVDFLKERL